MKEYKIEVRKYMTKKSSPDFTFMAKYNNDIPMPLMIMYGVKLKETKGMVYMRLHGDIKQRITQRCMCCGLTITNPVSQYFGMGPVCGDHNYVNPFETEEELKKAVAAYREKLINTIWEGWVIKSAIVSIDDDTDIYKKLAEMPIENLEAPKQEAKAEPKKPEVPVITAKVDKPNRCTDDFSVYLTFGYNPEFVAAVKNLRARYWNPDDKNWEIEYKELAELQQALPNVKFDIQNEEILPDKVEITDGFKFKTNPMPHQIEGVQYGLEHSRWLLADEQGLGKTKQIIDLALIRRETQNFKHCLIVCGVNGLKWNWLEEIHKHTMFDSGYILGQIHRKRSCKIVIGGTADKISDLDKLLKGDDTEFPYFLITNIESLRNTEIAAKLKELCENGIINMVAIDEIHRAKNLNTQQGEGMMQLQPDFRVAMTGTPLMNNPLDLYAILKWLGYQKYGFLSFRDHFCYRDEWGAIVGYKNIDQLTAQLGAIMLRRRKDEVLNLSEKIYMNEYVELSDEQKKLYNQIIDNAIADDELGEQINTDCILAIKLRLRQVSGGIGPFSFIKKNPKLDRLEQIVEEAIYNGTKVIVYSNWIEGIKPALVRLQKYNPVVITGETADADRQGIVNKFQNDPNVKVILGTIGAMGTGLTLTAATEVVFLDEPWTNATKEQAIDRAHRIGTKYAVTVHTLISYATYDEDVHDIVLGKKELSDRIVEKKDLAKLKIA